MKKILLMIFCAVFIPAATLAQDTTLYGVSDTMLTLAEQALTCAAAPDACSEAEAVAIKADLWQGMHESMSLLVSGNKFRMKLSGGQAAALRAKLAGLQGKLVQVSGMLQGVCNSGVAVFNYGLGLMTAIQIDLVLGALLWVIGLIILIPGSILMLTCPFWWL